MFDIGLQEMLLIGVLALLVFGPSKLPELGKMFGRALREFRRASDEFRSTVETNLNLNAIDEPTRWPAAPSESVAVTGPASGATDAAAPEPIVPSGETVAAVTTETDAGQPGEPFCAQRGSRLFHRRECAWARRIGVADRLPIASVAEGRAQGFATCPVCEPWEPS